MGTLSGREPAFYGASKIAEYLKQKIKQSKEKHHVLAEKCKYKHPNNIAMITSGRSKVALNKIPLFSKALNIDEAELFNMALKEYEPEVYELLNRHSITASNTEKELIILYRNIVNMPDSVISDRNLKRLAEVFNDIKNEKLVYSQSLHDEELENAQHR